MSGVNHQMQRYRAAAKTLWQEAPRWRRLAMAGGATAALWVVLAAWSGIRHPPQFGSSSLVFSSGSTPAAAPAPAAPRVAMCNAACNEALAALETTYAAWSKDDASGLNCERLLAAADQVAKLDPSLRDPKKSKLEDAERCRAPLLESDRRLAALKQASRGAATDVAAMAALVAAYTKISPFDQTRTLDSETSAAMAAAETAAKDVSQSDRRLAALLSAAAGSPDVPKSAEAMANAVASISAFDRTRFDPALQAAAAKAEAAAVAVKDSGERIQILKAAYDRRKDDPEALVTALGTLTPFDRDRLKTDSALGVDLSSVEAGIADVIPKAVAANADQFRQSQDRASADRLASLKALAVARGMKFDAAVEEQVSLAAQKIKDSNDLLQQGSRAAEHWRQARAAGDAPKEVADEVAGAYGKLSKTGICHPAPFDANGMSAVQRKDFQTLCLAVTALGQRPGSPLAGQRITLYLAAPDTSKDAMLKSLVSAVSQALAAKGFQMAAEPAGAALTVTLSSPRFSRPGTGVDDKTGQPVVSGEAAVATVWAFAAQVDDFGRITADGVAADAKSAFDLASKQLGAAIADRVAGHN